MSSAARPLPRWLTLSTGPAPAVVDGRACRTRAAFFEEVARALRLPGYFGRNWDALTDSLRDTDTDTDTAAVVLVVEHAEELLAAEPPEQLAVLLAVLADAAKAGLTVTLCTDPRHESQLRRRVTAALT
ncbi:barstar family protein [Streptosporangium sp. KLBMP 9127]|nr:barstar family protein [Streptosporangium sp. KLBMP 9127]